MLSVFMLIGALALQTPAANRETGQGFLKVCDAKDPGERDNMDRAIWLIGDANCSAYIEGVADTLVAARKTCAASGVTLGQNVAVVLKYLKDHPERLHEHRLLLVATALTEAFPCKTP